MPFRRGPDPVEVPDASSNPGCQLWWAQTSDARPELATLLPPEEVRRMERYRRPEDRGRFLTAWALARIVVGRMLDLAPADVPVERTCPRCGADHGKPRIGGGSGVEVSLSKAGDRVVVAVARGQAIGVDAERTGAPLTLEVASMVLSPAEREDLRGVGGGLDRATLLRYWVRKEAVVKATGDGLLVAMPTFTVSQPADPPRLVTWPPDPGLPNRLTLRDVPCPPSHLAAVAVIGEAGFIGSHDGSALLAGAGRGCRGSGYRN